MKIQFKQYQLRVISAWLTNLSAGWFASTFFLLAQPWIATGSFLLSLICLYVSGIIEQRLDKPS